MDELERGLDLIRKGRYFEAHEELEIAWRAAAPEERDFYQGLVHAAVAWYQAGRGKPVTGGRQRLRVCAVEHARRAEHQLPGELREGHAGDVGEQLLQHAVTAA